MSHISAPVRVGGSWLVVVGAGASCLVVVSVLRGLELLDREELTGLPEKNATEYGSPVDEVGFNGRSTTVYFFPRSNIDSEEPTPIGWVRASFE